MAPITQPWSNVNLLERILQKSEGDNSIRVVNMHSEAATAKGDNYTSEMRRVFVKFSRDTKPDVTETKSILIKCAYHTEGAQKDLSEKTPLFDTEMSMMTNTLKKMNKMLGPKYRLSPECYEVQRESPKFLVLEDLQPLGFRMKDRREGLDLEHTLMTFRSLGRFHGSSVAVCEQDPNHKNLYPFYPYEEFKDFYVQSAQTLAKEVATWPELGPTYAEKIMKFSDHIYEKLTDSTKYREDDFNVICHGDYWINNMLFRYDESGKPVEHIMVDFQACEYSSPVRDLFHCFATNPAVEVMEENKELLLEEYLHTLSSTMRQLNCKTAAPTMEELKKCMEERLVCSMILSITVLPVLITDKSQAQDLSDLISNDTTAYAGYKDSMYRKIVVKRIPEYVKLGLLD